LQIDSSTDFTALALIDPILQAVKDEGYTVPSPVQAAAIPIVMDGSDLIATAKTGTGKTAAFAIPMLQLLHESGVPGDALRGLILTPTRELALQIHESLQTYGRHLKLTHAVIVGGVSAGPQIQALRRRPDILVATPGRLLDLMGQGKVRLRNIEIAVLDEADRMLDMGFIRDVRRIVDALPRQRQTLLFSATMSREITQLAGEMLHKPERVEVTPPATVADNITQKVMFVDQGDKRDLLVKLLKSDDSIASALVFTRTRHRANRVARQLSQSGISADAIHSDKSQGARQKALDLFDRGKVRVLVATDIVARGIDVDGITHVINFEIPNEAESYVHRIGRTARAGAAGIALSFCNAEEIAFLADIEKLTGVRLQEVDEHPYRHHGIASQRDAGHSPPKKKSRSNGNGGNGGGGNGSTNGKRSGGGTSQRGQRSPAAGAESNGNGRGPRRKPRGEDSRPQNQPTGRPTSQRESRSNDSGAPKPAHFGRRPRTA
jgi:ATP-dependent RNA helicase RhlE